MFVLKQTTDQKESPMESTLCCTCGCNVCYEHAARAESGEVVVTPGALLAAFAEVPDPRRRQGTRFGLSAILALAACAILSNHLSVLAIAEWGARSATTSSPRSASRTASPLTSRRIQRLFRRLDPDALSEALTSHFARLTAPSSESAEPSSVLEAAKGSPSTARPSADALRFDSSGCTVHALSAYLHDLGVVLAQEPIESASRRYLSRHGPAPQSSEPSAQRGGQDGG